ncbi:MAG: aminotransferase class IV [Caldilineaceae bacterium]|nr:aminotransferase class IV [Caldilineaceae bacterium]
MPDYTYYVNGEFVPASQAAVGLNDLGLVRGYGIFEVLRTYGTAPFGLRPHLLRLERSAAQIDLPLPWTVEELERIVYATMERNDATDVTIRIVVTGGASSSFLMPEGAPTLLVMLAPVRLPADHYYSDGATLISVDFERFMPTVKSLNYIPAIMGLQRARKEGAIEALYRAPDGQITECTTCNLFMFKGDQLITAGAGVLDGITRATVLELAEDLYDVVQRPVYYSEIAEADEVFITSTTKEVMPVVRVDEIGVGAGRPGPKTQRLRELFHAFVRSTSVPLPPAR